MRRLVPLAPVPRRRGAGGRRLDVARAGAGRPGVLLRPRAPVRGRAHRGIDVGADAGVPVLAPAGGTVSYAGTLPTSGVTVTIATGDGFAVTLTHLGTRTVAKGDTVAEGDAVGTVGPSGTPEVDGTYVHLGIRLASDPNGYLDPISLLPVVAPEPASAPPAAAGSDSSAPVTDGSASGACARRTAGCREPARPAAQTLRRLPRPHPTRPRPRLLPPSRLPAEPAPVEAAPAARSLLLLLLLLLRRSPSRPSLLLPWRRPHSPNPHSPNPHNPNRHRHSPNRHSPNRHSPNRLRLRSHLLLRLRRPPPSRRPRPWIRGPTTSCRRHRIRE